MNKWKELNVDELPPDILTGKYEFQNIDIHTQDEDPLLAMECLLSGDKIKYRRKEKPAPTHKEIMLKWWECGGLWMRVITYEPREPHPYKVYGYRDFVDKTFFDGLESAVIPPEGE